MVINSIDDLKKIDEKQLPQVCEEIRQKIVSQVLQNGGHLSGSLGAVELAVALRYVFDKGDKICWDVGHQAYADKILTGRGENFFLLRKKDGLSGFPDAEESSFDSFTVGHAGTAISQALGLCRARDSLGQHHKVVAVVGDGSLTCGLTYEALNNAKDTDLLIVVNDNNMSISQSVGTSTLNLSKLRVGKYDKSKQRLKTFLNKIPLVGKPTYRFLRWCKRRAKLGFYRNSYFDNFDIKYIGIIDGNEIKDLVYYLKKIRQNVTKPTILHVVTKKGKGYLPAENQPSVYHAVPVGADFEQKLESSVVVGDTLTELGKDSNAATVCAAMSQAVGFEPFRKKYPDRFWDVGIAEEHAVTFAGGLAKGGLKPFVGIYSTFLQRAYDQILHDVALQGLPVTILADRAGFVGEDGRTHQGLFDLSYLQNIPNLSIWTPSTYGQLAQMLKASVNLSAPNVIRYPRYLLERELPDFDGKWVVAKSCDNPKARVLAVGPRMLQNALDADLPHVEVVCVTTVKPLDEEYLAKVDCPVLTLEENVLQGGFGQSVAAFFAKNKNVSVTCRGVDDRFVSQATVDEQIAQNGLDTESIKKITLELLQNC